MPFSRLIVVDAVSNVVGPATAVPFKYTVYWYLSVESSTPSSLAVADGVTVTFEPSSD